MKKKLNRVRDIIFGDNEPEFKIGFLKAIFLDDADVGSGLPESNKPIFDTETLEKSSDKKGRHSFELEESTSMAEHGDPLGHQSVLPQPNFSPCFLGKRSDQGFYCDLDLSSDSEDLFAEDKFLDNAANKGQLVPGKNELVCVDSDCSSPGGN
jgi:hypothetical protein